MMKTKRGTSSWVAIRVVIQAATKEQLNLAAKEMNIEIKHAREMIIRDNKISWQGTGTRYIEVK
jgi:hypothetical protein